MSDTASWFYQKQEKEKAMNNNESVKLEDKPFVYDPAKCKEEISLDLEDEILVRLAIQAHERDITLNHLFNEILYDALKKPEFKFNIKGKTEGPVLLNENHD